MLVSVVHLTGVVVRCRTSVTFSQLLLLLEVLVVNGTVVAPDDVILVLLQKVAHLFDFKIRI